jgi:hypothetical protein
MDVFTLSKGALICRPYEVLCPMNLQECPSRMRKENHEIFPHPKSTTKWWYHKPTCVSKLSQCSLLCVGDVSLIWPVSSDMMNMHLGTQRPCPQSEFALHHSSDTNPAASCLSSFRICSKTLRRMRHSIASLLPIMFRLSPAQMARSSSRYHVCAITNIDFM